MTQRDPTTHFGDRTPSAPSHLGFRSGVLRVPGHTSSPLGSGFGPWATRSKRDLTTRTYVVLLRDSGLPTRRQRPREYDFGGESPGDSPTGLEPLRTRVNKDRCHGSLRKSRGPRPTTPDKGPPSPDTDDRDSGPPPPSRSRYKSPSTTSGVLKERPVLLSSYQKIHLPVRTTTLGEQGVPKSADGSYSRRSTGLRWDS